ncbi:unnamed protein product [Bemisia tabaci]|uniref:N-acetyltransferase domain-containing protein n=1 Tax=Bemisia tabaci TaxID=7038 RepID=A0A9P0AI20_BEMTA|nr:unnamed protein product [Bemisia tabaci]
MDLPNDPLQPIPWTQMEGLSKKLLADAPYSLVMHGTIRMALRWRETEAGQRITIYSTNNRLDDAGIVGIYKKPGSKNYRITLYCFSEDTSVLQNALLKTQRFDWDSPDTTLFFSAIPEKLMPVLERTLPQRNCKFEFKCNTTYKWRTPDQLDSCDHTCPPDVRLAPLSLEYVKLVQSHWFDDVPDAADYITTLITHNQSMGAYSRSTGELCAFVLFSEFCTMTILHTMEEHRRKGYAQLIINAICQRLLAEGLIVGATVIEGNTASLKLFELLGFNTSRDFFLYTLATPLTPGQEEVTCKKIKY